MKTPRSGLVDLAASLLEAGLSSLNGAMRMMQTTIGALTWQTPPPPLNEPPWDGPNNLDAAVSEFANRMLRIAWSTPPGGDTLDDVIRAARHCFGYLDLRDPRNIVVALQIPLSIGSMLAESSLRGLAALQVGGLRRWPTFAENILEVFSDIAVYQSLQYQELIDRYNRHLEKAPRDSRTRLQLGRTYIKCGRYQEAIRELALVAGEGDAALRSRAMHESAVAFYRSGQYDQAVRHEAAAMDANPSNDRARMWLWMSAQKLGGYPPDVADPHRMEVKAGYEPTALEFEDIASRIGLDKTSAGSGLAVFDFNNDSYLDVLINGMSAGCSLYRNNGNGTFTDVSVDSGLDRCTNSWVVAIGDYNNDGYPDVYVTRLAVLSGTGALYRNNGDGTFTDVTAEAGIKTWGPAFAASWADYDCDGNLDLFVAHNLGGVFDRKTPNCLFHNNGEGTFTEVSQKAGLRTSWPTIGAAWGDYNNDGYPDLFLSNAMGRPQLFRNNGDGTFTDVSWQAGFRDFCSGFVAFWCDYDNDGWLDIVQFTWSEHEDVIRTMRTGEGPPDGSPMRVYHNNRNGTFTLASQELGLTGCWGTMSGNCGDLNNDGHLDVVLGNGSPRMDRLEPTVVLENDGRGKFHNVTFSAGLPFTGKSHGANLADLFGDGRLSILVAAGGVYPGDLLTASVFYPKRLPGNYLNVRLVGTKSNRDAIGARLMLEAGGRQYREVSGGSNFGCLPLEQHFGLCHLKRVGSLEIRWPSGLCQRLENIPANKTIRITEGREQWEDVYRRTEVAASA